MVLTTLVAATTYGWIEGFALRAGEYGSEQWQATQNLWILGHFSTYSVAMALLFACISGAFALIKGRSMFIKGKRYFLLTFAGNYPFSWLVEDFAFFWFYPEARLNDTAWTNWGFGGVWLLDPWRSGVKIWIPNWYWIALAFWLVMMFLAHRCTVYDNLVKDEIARDLIPSDVIPSDITIPRAEVKKPERPQEMVGSPAPGAQAETKPETTQAERVSAESPPCPTEVPQPSTTSPKPDRPPSKRPTLEPRRRSPEAEVALKKLRERWVKTDAAKTS